MKLFFLFKNESNIIENRERNESDHCNANQLRFKANYELFAEQDIIDILNDKSGSEIEDIQSFIITALTDQFDIEEQEFNSNCLFRALMKVDLVHLYLSIRWGKCTRLHLP